MFARVGKAGSEVQAYTEAISRLVSVALQHGVDPSKVYDQMMGISGQKVVFHSIGRHKRILSVVDAIGKAMEFDSSLFDSQNNPVSFSPPKSTVVHKSPLALQEETGEVCPVCNQHFHCQEGCKSCGCGSKCDPE